MPATNMMPRIIRLLSGCHANPLFLAVLLGLFGIPDAQKRCDLLVKSTPGQGPESVCLDLVALTNGGPTIQTVGNATRISTDDFRLCKNAFQVEAGAAADVVFIMDNSSSMTTKKAFVSAAGDTTYVGGSTNGSTQCSNEATQGTVTYQTSVGPLTVPKLISAQGCPHLAGDPFKARGEVIREAIDFMAANSPLSTAGFISFARSSGDPQPPIQLNNAANVAQVKSRIALRDIDVTNFLPPLDSSKRWLTSPGLIKTSKQAIIFVTDGEHNVGRPEDTYLSLVDAKMPPIYGIYLGKNASPDTANLLELCNRSGGRYYRVDPQNVPAIRQVMQTIVQSLLITTLPGSIEITNTSLVPPQQSRSVNLVRNADSSVSAVLDSIIALKVGLNEFKVRISLNDTASRSYTFKVQADGPAAPASTEELACFDPPKLVMLNTQGVEDWTYASGVHDYRVRLNRSSSDLTTVMVATISKDETQRQPWGDSETVVLNLNGTSSGVTTYQGPFSLNGSTLQPVRNNGILESDANGRVLLHWAHPRDPREFADYELSGRRIPSVTPFISWVRVNDAPRGSILSGPIKDPIVIRGGATLVQVGDSTTVSFKNCLYNCGGNAEKSSEPAKTPSFVFKTASPFRFEIRIYDHLGNFVNYSKGSIDAAQWQSLPRQGDSVAVVMSFVPVARNGHLIGTGVYILQADIQTQPLETRDSLGNLYRVAATRFALSNRFGFVRDFP